MLNWRFESQGQIFDTDEEFYADDEEAILLNEIVDNKKLSQGFLALAHHFRVMEPKTPDDVYKVYTSTQHPSFSCWICMYCLHLFDI